MKYRRLQEFRDTHCSISSQTEDDNMKNKNGAEGVLQRSSCAILPSHAETSSDLCLMSFESKCITVSKSKLRAMLSPRFVMHRYIHA
jgi:hypothetical protein